MKKLKLFHCLHHQLSNQRMIAVKMIQKMLNYHNFKLQTQKKTHFSAPIGVYYDRLYFYSYFFFFFRAVVLLYFNTVVIFYYSISYIGN